MRVGLIGTGAISRKHAQAYRNLGFPITVCTNKNPEKGRQFASETGAVFVDTVAEVCRHPEVDYVDVCTFPDFRLEPLRLCAENGKHILVQKPMAIDTETARVMIEEAGKAGIQLGVVSQHRFDDASLFLHRAIKDGRLGKILQADAYVKWYRSAEYYSRPVKGSWQVEGGGAMINQAIHQVDLLLWLAGPAESVFATWQLGSLHRIESEDVITALLTYRSGATGVIQASTAFWPGYSERVEIHGTKGTAIITGDKLTAWDVADDQGDAPPLESSIASGASDPMAISLAPFERQFTDFSQSIQERRPPLVSGEEGLKALELVTSAYRSCRSRQPVEVPSGAGS